jgi:hypothetical protein
LIRYTHRRRQGQHIKGGKGGGVKWIKQRMVKRNIVKNIKKAGFGVYYIKAAL